MRPTFLPYCRPQVTEQEIEAAAACMRDGWLTTGPAVKVFEKDFVQASGVTHAVALNSCTAALHVALAAMGVGPGDEVVMPSLTFVAGAQCTLELGGTPVFADVDASTLTITPATVAAVTTRRTKVIVTMPYAGRPHGVREMIAFAHERGILVLEDAAHAAGMLDRGSWSGAESDAAAYSFYATKNLTTAEGGMLVTRSDELAERTRMLSLHGMSRDAWNRYGAGGSWRYDVVRPGFKYNLADPMAAIGIGQLRRLEEMQLRRDALARHYLDALDGIPGISFQAAPESPGDRHSWCMFVIIVDPRRCGVSRDELIEGLRSENIGTSVHYIPTHLMSAYRGLARDPLPVTEYVWQRLVSLPLFPSMSDQDVEDVVGAVRHVVGTASDRSAAS